MTTGPIDARVANTARARSPATLRLRPLLALALADVRRDGLLTVCSVLMLAATMAPLLTLYGLENGVIGTLITRQDNDPSMRLVLPEVTGAHRFDRAWFDTVATWPEVTFVLPSTRSIAGLIDLVAVSPAPTAGEPVRVSLTPTAAGDPMTAGFDPHGRLDEVVLSASAARKLQATTGAALTAIVERVRDGRTEPAMASLRVAGVLPAGVDGDAAYASLALVEAVQAYRDGHAVAALGWAGEGAAAASDAYPLFRLYARSIRDVASAVHRLQAQGISTFSRDAEIAATVGLQANLVAVLLMLSGLTGVGFAVAMIALQIATVRRKRRDYAILQLIGHGRAWLIALPCCEALLLAGVGLAVAFGLYAITATAIDLYFADHLARAESACRLAIGQAAWLSALAIFVSLAPAVLAGYLASTTDPGDTLRDV